MNIISIQHLRCLIGSSVSAILRMLLSITSRMNSLRSSMHRACSSCSMKISISSSSYRFTNSYSAIRASTRSISPFRPLFFSRAAKCSFLSFSSSAMMRSRSLSWLRMVPYTAAILPWMSLPLLSSLSSTAVLRYNYPLLFPACCQRFLQVMPSSAIELVTPFSLPQARLMSSLFSFSSAYSLELSFSAWYSVFSSRAFPDQMLLTSFSTPFSLAICESSQLESCSHSSSSLFLSSLSPLRERLSCLFSSLLLWFLFSASLIWNLMLWISAVLPSHCLLMLEFSLSSSSMTRLDFWSCTLRSSISPLSSMVVFLSISNLSFWSFSLLSFSASRREYLPSREEMSSMSRWQSPSSCLSSKISFLSCPITTSFCSHSFCAAWWALVAGQEQSRYLLYITDIIQLQIIVTIQIYHTLLVDLQQCCNKLRTPHTCSSRPSSTPKRRRAGPASGCSCGWGWRGAGSGGRRR